MSSSADYFPKTPELAVLTTQPVKNPLPGVSTIPEDVQRLAEKILACPVDCQRYGLPKRTWVMEHCPGLLDARRRIMRKTHPMFAFLGDTSLLNDRLWAWLCFNGPACEVAGLGSYDVQYRDFLLRKNAVPATSLTQVSASLTPVQNTAVKVTKSPSATPKRQRKRQRTTNERPSPETSPDQIGCVHSRAECQHEDCNAMVCPVCDYAEDSISEAQRNILSTGSLMPLCVACEGKATDVRAYHCDCLALRGAIACREHFVESLEMIDAQMEYHWYHHRLCELPVHGRHQTVYLCFCGKQIEQESDIIRKCAACAVHVRRPFALQASGVMYMAGLGPYYGQH